MKHLLQSIALCTLTLVATRTIADPGSKSLQGGIDMNFAQQESSYAISERTAIQFIRDVQVAAESAAKGAPKPVAAADPRGLSYLTAVYLQCSVTNGTCPFLLNAILEADMINSRLNNTEACPNLTEFWRTWLKNGMEERHKYLTKTAYLVITSEFNSKQRPKYVRCTDTIHEQSATEVDDTKFFAARYADGSPAKKELAMAVGYLEETAKKGANVFAVVGAGTGSAAASDSDQKEKK